MIPNQWEPRSVGSMGSAVAGKALAVRGPGQLRPYLRTKNVFDGRIDLADVLLMPMTDSQFAAYQLHPGDVLLNEGQSLELVGRCAIYSGEYHVPCAIQNQLVRFRAYDGVSAEYAAHLFRYCQQTGVFARIALQTTSIAHLGVGRFERLLLPWPVEEAEQRAIAAALSDVDALVGALDKLIAKKRAIKLAAMQQLLTGKTRLPGFNDAWRPKRLGDIADVSAGGTPSRTNPKYWNGDIPWITTTQIDFGTITEATQFISREGLVNSAGRLYPPGTLLMALNGQGKTRGKTAVLGIEAATNQACAAISLRGKISPVYVLQNLASRYSEIRDMSNTGNQENLNSHIVKGIVIPLPSEEEQLAIASVLAGMDAEITALERRRDKTKAIKQGMMQALLTGRVRLVKPDRGGGEST